MKLTLLFERVLPTRLKRVQREKEQLSQYASQESLDVLAELNTEFGFEGDLAKIFSQNKGF